MQAAAPKQQYLDPADRALDVLALAPVVLDDRFIFRDRHDPFKLLVLRGLAEADVEGEGKWAITTYRLTADGWRTVHARKARQVSLDTAIRRRNLDEKAEVRKLLTGLKRAARAVGPRQRVFPSIRDVTHRFLVESQITAPTLNEDEGISHPEVTRWYVEQYEKLNNFRRSA